MAEDFVLQKEDILKVIEEDEELEIIENREDGLLLYDSQEAKELPVHFLEKMNAQKLSEMIHISDNIPPEYKINKEKLSDYLWSVCDKNTFVTLNEIDVFWDDEDSRIDPERLRLYEEYNDEFAFYAADDYLGQLWYERNIVTINMRRIVETSQEIYAENRDMSFDSFFDFDNLVVNGLLTTLVHELRHLEVDTNIFLPEDKYPLHLSAEKEVEDYCRDVFESNPVPADAISFKSVVYIMPAKDDTWSACISDTKPEGKAYRICDEQEYPFELCFRYVDANGRTSYSFENCNDREELINCLNWMGSSRYVLCELWDFDINNVKDKGLIELFNNCSSRRRELLKDNKKGLQSLIFSAEKKSSFQKNKKPHSGSKFRKNDEKEM